MALPAVAAGIIAAIIPALISAIVWLAKKLMIAFGVGFVAYKGVQPLIQWLIDSIISLIVANDPFNIAGWLGWMMFDEALSVVISAYGFALGVKVYDRVMFRWKLNHLSI